MIKMAWFVGFRVYKEMALKTYGLVQIIIRWFNMVWYLFIGKKIAALFILCSVTAFAVDVVDVDLLKEKNRHGLFKFRQNVQDAEERDDIASNATARLIGHIYPSRKTYWLDKLRYWMSRLNGPRYVDHVFLKLKHPDAVDEGAGYYFLPVNIHDGIRNVSFFLFKHTNNGVYAYLGADLRSIIRLSSRTRLEAYNGFAETVESTFTPTLVWMSGQKRLNRLKEGRFNRSLYQAPKFVLPKESLDVVLSYFDTH